MVAGRPRGPLGTTRLERHGKKKRKIQGRTAWKYVQIPVGKAVECADASLEVLSDDLLGYMRQPVCQQERAAIVKLAVIKDQEELGSLRVISGGLQAVRLARREVPQVALALRDCLD